MIGLSSIKKHFDDLKSDRDHIVKNIDSLTTRIKDLETDYENSLVARSTIQMASESTLGNIEIKISDLVTSSLRSINPEWPKMVVKFVTRRNKTECDLLFEENGFQYKPIHGSGGGAIDIADIALRITLLHLQPGHTNRRIIILDEPFRNLSSGLQSKASHMLKLIIDLLGIQLLIVSHQDDINDMADATFFVQKINNKSLLKEEK